MHAVPKPPTVAPVPARATERIVRPTHRRGDVWMVQDDPDNPPIGNEIWPGRPALVISSDVYNRRSGFALVVYLTTSIKKQRSSPTNVGLPPLRGGSSKRADEGSVALCSQIHTVDSSRLSRRLGYYQPEEIKDVEAAVSLTLAIGKHGAPSTAALYSKWDKQLDEHGIDIAAEVQALANQVVDQRVQALQKALALALVQRNSLHALYEAAKDEAEVADQLVQALSNAAPKEAA